MTTQPAPQIDVSGWAKPEYGQTITPNIVDRKAGYLVAAFAKRRDRDACLHAVQSIGRLEKERDELREHFAKAAQHIADRAVQKEQGDWITLQAAKTMNEMIHTLTKERDALQRRVEELEKQTAYLTPAASRQRALRKKTMRLNVRLEAELATAQERARELERALSNMLEDGDKTDREAAMRLLGWDKAHPALLQGKTPS